MSHQMFDKKIIVIKTVLNNKFDHRLQCSKGSRKDQ